MRFFIDSTAAPAVPCAAYFKNLMECVTTSLDAATLTRAQGKMLCEYLDCLDAKTPGLRAKHRASAKQRLCRYLNTEACDEVKALLSLASPSAMAILKEAAKDARACAANQRSNLTYLFG